MAPTFSELYSHGVSVMMVGVVMLKVTWTTRTMTQTQLQDVAHYLDDKEEIEIIQNCEEKIKEMLYRGMNENSSLND